MEWLNRFPDMWASTQAVSEDSDLPTTVAPPSEISSTDPNLGRANFSTDAMFPASETEEVANEIVAAVDAAIQQRINEGFEINSLGDILSRNDNTSNSSPPPSDHGSSEEEVPQSIIDCLGYPDTQCSRCTCGRPKWNILLEYLQSIGKRPVRVLSLIHI